MLLKPTRQCPHCHSRIPRGARVCAHCTRESATTGELSTLRVLLVVLALLALAQSVCGGPFQP